jgi:hypothetical protein
MITLVLYIGSLPNLATWFPCGRGRTRFILGSLPLYRLIIYIDRHILWCTHFSYKFLNTLSCEKDPVDKNYIYSNSDLDIWPNDPKINRVLPLPQGKHVAKFGKDLIYRTKVIVRKPVWTPARPPYPITQYGPVSRQAYKKIYLYISRG